MALPRPQPDPLETTLSRALNEAMAWERDVIVRRFGLAGPGQTLEEVGLAYGMTRERVRQIEAKALRGLKLRHNGELSALIGKDSAGIWRRLAGWGDLVTSRGVSRAARTLSPSFRLALALCGLTIWQWLDIHAQPRDGGWAAPATGSTSPAHKLPRPPDQP